MGHFLTEYYFEYDDLNILYIITSVIVLKELWSKKDYFISKRLLLIVFFQKIHRVYIKVIIHEFIKIISFRNINRDKLFNNIAVAENRRRLKDIN